MNKTFRLYGIIFIVVMILMVLLVANKRDIVDWRKNYDVSKKTPFGLFIFNQEADSIFGGNLKREDNSPYDFYAQDSVQAKHNILVIAENLDDESWYSILDQAYEGSQVMIITASDLPYIDDFADLSIQPVDYEEKSWLKLTDEKYKKDSLVLDKLPTGQGFRYLLPDYEILGSTNSIQRKGANFIRMEYGEGNVYIHTEPLFLTNYYLLRPNAETYLKNVFSYLPNQRTVWFTQGKSNARSKSGGPLSFILANPPLKYAWRLLLGGLVLFILFNIKRKQRIIPIIEPLKNKSVEFVKSVGNLYLQEGDFQDMMMKKIQYFLHRVRMDLLLDTSVLDDNFAQKLQLKTGKELYKINKAITLIQKAQNPNTMIEKADFLELNDLLDYIYK